MSVQSEIDRIITAAGNAYSKVSEKGGTVPASQTVANLATAIDSIPAGGGGGGGGSSGAPLDPVEVYNNTRPSDWLPMPTPADNEMYLLFHIPDGFSSLLAFTVTCTGNYTVALGSVSDGAFVQMSSTTVASGSKYEAELFADDYSDLTSYGMKQVMVKVSGTDILTWAPSTHSKKTSPSNFAVWNIVEIACRIPSGTSVACGSGTENSTLKKLRYFTWHGENAVTSMSYMFSNCNSLTAIPQLDTSAVTDMRSMFSNCYSLTAIPQLDTLAVTDMRNMFSSCYSLTAIPQLDTSAVTKMGSMFSGCRPLTAIPQLDTSAVTDMSYMFSFCYSLTAIPQMDTSAVTNMSYMFSNCNSLTAIPQLDTSAVTNMSYMFSNCYSLTAIPQMDTSAVTNMSYMFGSCNSLTAIPQLDTSAVTNMSYMFGSCNSLTAIPQLDTSAVTNMSGMFSNCYSLTAIPQLDTLAVTKMSGMFGGCYSLTAVPQLDTSAVTDMRNMFNNCMSLTAITLNNTVTGWAGYAISLRDCSLSHAAIVAFFNSLPTITSAKAITLTNNPGVSELTNAEKAIATGKGWTLTL